MSVTAIALSLLLGAAQTAAEPAPAAPAAAETTTWSWCVADSTGPEGTVRYFSDPFEGDTDVNVEGAFREYVDRAYSKTRKTSGYVVSCTSAPTHAAADTALRAASAAQPATTIVMTAWRFHFE